MQTQQKPQSPPLTLPVVVIGLLSVAAFVFLAILLQNDSALDSVRPATPQPAAASRPESERHATGYLTRSRYDAIEMGMTRAEVERTLGKRGEKFSEHEYQPGKAWIVRVERFMWRDGSKKVIVSFRNDSADYKSQDGLD